MSGATTNGNGNGNGNGVAAKILSIALAAVVVLFGAAYKLLLDRVDKVEAVGDSDRDRVRVEIDKAVSAVDGASKGRKDAMDHSLSEYRDTQEAIRSALDIELHRQDEALQKEMRELVSNERDRIDALSRSVEWMDRRYIEDLKEKARGKP